MQTQRQYRHVLSKRKPKNSTKNLSATLQAVKWSIKEYSWDTWIAEDPSSLIYSMHLNPPSFLLQASCSNRVTPNLVFFSFSDPAISPLHQPSKLVISELLPKHPNTSSLIWVWWDKDLANVPLKDMSMKRVRVEEFRESNDEDCGWVNLAFL